MYEQTQNDSIPRQLISQTQKKPWRLINKVTAWVVFTLMTGASKVAIKVAIIEKYCDFCIWYLRWNPFTSKK